MNRTVLQIAVVIGMTGCATGGSRVPMDCPDLTLEIRRVEDKLFDEGSYEISVASDYSLGVTTCTHVAGCGAGGFFFAMTEDRHVIMATRTGRVPTRVVLTLEYEGKLLGQWQIEPDEGSSSCKTVELTSV